MTITRKQIAAKARENPTEAEASLWAEISGLRTGARWTRKKWRYGILTDLYSDGLKLAILFPNRKRSTEQLNTDVETLRSHGIDAVVLDPIETTSHPERKFVHLTHKVYETLFEAARSQILSIEGVESIDYREHQIHIALSVPETSELRTEIFAVARKFAAGCHLHIQGKDPDTNVEGKSEQEQGPSVQGEGQEEGGSAGLI